MTTDPMDNAQAHVEIEELNEDDYRELEGFCDHCGAMLFPNDNLCPDCGKVS